MRGKINQPVESDIETIRVSMDNWISVKKSFKGCGFSVDPETERWTMRAPNGDFLFQTENDFNDCVIVIHAVKGLFSEAPRQDTGQDISMG